MEWPNLNNVMTIDPNECVNVCEHSVVEYIGSATLFNGNNMSEFEWSVTGGEIISVDGVAQSSGTMVATSGNLGSPNGTYSSVEIQWGNVGLGTITTTETTPYIQPANCQPKTTILCIDIIEKPNAGFLMDDLTSLPADCYYICKDQIVSFFDLSTGSSSSPILFWEWNFGDGSPISHQQNPSHQYTQSGDYDVSLTVTNRCNCTSTFSIVICVDEQPGLNIACPSVVCEDETVTYTVDANCDSYSWLITGGTQIMPQQDPDITVKWDQVSSDGFGYLSIDGSYCHDVCPAISKIRVPVILKTAVIEGPQITCENQSYRFELPSWPATNFSWLLTNNTNGATFSTLPQRDNFTEIKTGATGGSFELSCSYENTITRTKCQGTATITVNVLPKPTITVQDKSCINLSVPCTLSISPTGQSEWTVIRPDGTVMTQSPTSGNTVSLSSGYFNMEGIYRISTSSLNGEYCNPEFVNIEIIDKPPTPVAIYGEDQICIGYPYTYTTDIIENTITEWNLAGANIPSQSWANTRSATWTSTGSKTISVQYEWEDIPGCVSSSFTKTINNVSVSGNIVGNNSTYEDMINVYVFNNTGVAGELYEWIVTPIGVGNIVSGQGTQSCSINWLHQTAPVTATVQCKVTKCGTTSPFSLSVYVDKSAEIISVTSIPTTVCSGNSVTFTVNSTGAPVSEYIWDFGDGNTQTFTPSAPTSVSTIIHPFHNTGTTSIVYPVKVKVRSSNNLLITSTMVTNITVNPIPNVSLSPTNTIIPPSSFPVQLNVASTTSTGNVYQWYFMEEGTTTTLSVGTNSNTYSVLATPPSPALSSFGTYWCEVTNNSGCSKSTNKASVGDANPLPNCTALAPAGISGMPASYTATSTNPCGGSIQVNCTTAGTVGTNIISYNWNVDPGGHHTSTGTATINQSPVYTFSTAGIYQIKLIVNYVNNIPNDPPCTHQAACNVSIPMVADMEWGLGCDASGNAYELILYDYSTLMPNYTLATRKWEIISNAQVVMTIYSLANQTTTYTVPASLLGTNIDVKLSITNTQQGSSVVCTKTENLNIPVLPVASYTTVTTYDPSNPNKSCEGREIEFINNSTGDIHTHVWDFGTTSPIEKSYMVHTAEIYYVTGLSVDYFPTLTVIDKYGCNDTETHQITIYNNDLKRKPGGEYDPAFSEVCPDLVLPQPIDPQHIGGAAIPLSYQWYKEADLLTGVNTPTLINLPKGSGAYWVRIMDKHNCYLDLNPTPALISEKEAPTAIIIGKPDACQGDLPKLYVNTGMGSSANLSYLWTPNSYTTKEIMPFLIIGVNPYIVKVTDLSPGGCEATSSPFNITLHPQPATPNISAPVAVNCDNYELSLTATSSVTNPKYTWSNGTSGNSTSIFNGGAYRVWVYDQYGCVNQNEIAVQYPPDFYFWRFPTGCYTYCYDELPKHVWPSTWTYGNGTILFDYWAWMHDGAILTINGPGYAGCSLGSSTTIPSIPCRLLIDHTDPYTPGGSLPPPAQQGEGEGDYSWVLDNSLCRQESDIMSISIIECCKLDFEIEELRCLQSLPTGNIYSFIVIAHNVPCSTKFNLSGTSNMPWPIAIDYSSLSTTSLIPGYNIISGTFTISNNNSTAVQFFINILCENCTGETPWESLPSCSGPRLGNIIQPSSDTNLVELVNINVYPNPANNYISVIYQFHEDIPNEQNTRVLCIMDAMGHTIETIEIDNINGEYKLNVSKYASGIYFVGIIQNRVRLMAKRFIINH